MQVQANTTAGGTEQGGASDAAHDIVAAAVQAAASDVNGSSAAADGTTRKDGGKAEASTGTTETDTSGESKADADGNTTDQDAGGAKKDAGAKGQYTPEELAKVTDLFDLDPDRLPEELRRLTLAAQRKATKKFEDIAKQKRAGQSEDRKTQSTTPKPTQMPKSFRDGDKEVSLDDLWNMAMESPEGFVKAVALANRAMLPGEIESHVRSVEEQQRGVAETRSRQTQEAIDLLSEDYPELDDPKFQELVADQIKTSRRIASVIAGSDDVHAVANALEMAVMRARTARSTAVARAAKAEQEKKEKEKSDREKANANEQAGTVAARKGGKVSQGDGGPMTVERSVQEAIAEVKGVKQ